MFGFVIANVHILSDEERRRYKSVYCGLCRSLKRRHGFFGRLALNYDMTFLLMALSSLYEPECSHGCERCFVHPLKAHPFYESEISNYAADMTVALAYLNQLDNWHDEGNALGFLISRLLKKKFERVRRCYPRQCGAMTDCIEALSGLEARREANPDVGARLFGHLMAELFVLKTDRWTDILRAMGMALGEFIYIMDAAVDLDRDLKRRRYNPLAALKNERGDDDAFREILTVLIGNCTMEFEKLPLVEDVSIMRNILYSGVWTQYEMAQARKKGGARR